MPNWCENVLVVQAPTPERASEIIDMLRDEVDKTDLSFHGVIPMPPELVEGGWYEWRLANWGTKWNANDVQMTVDPHHAGVIQYYFQTAWSPPVEWVETFAERHPDLILTLSYDEPGMDFGGYVVLRGTDTLDRGDGSSRHSTWHDIAEWAMESAAYRDARADVS